MAVNGLNGKTIVIDGVEYRLERVEKKNKVIVSMETPFGLLQRVVDADGFALEDGVYDEYGTKFHVERVSEDELKEKLGKPIEDADDVELALMMAAVL